MTINDPRHIAQALLTHLGLTAEDLLWTPPPTIPTIADYLSAVIAASGAGARRTYGTYWNRILDTFGPRRLDQVTATDIETLMRHVIAHRVQRANHQAGQYAGQHLIGAIRVIYTHAVADGLIPGHRNPAAMVANPDDHPPPAGHCTPANSPPSTPSPPPPATTPHWTPSSCDCTPKPPAAAPPHCTSPSPTWTPTGT
jgi:hypothetical protein